MHFKPMITQILFLAAVLSLGPACGGNGKTVMLPDSSVYIRAINGTVYTLKPDSRLLVFPFPKNVTSVNSNMTQNY